MFQCSDGVLCSSVVMECCVPAPGAAVGAGDAAADVPHGGACSVAAGPPPGS